MFASYQMLHKLRRPNFKALVRYSGSSKYWHVWWWDHWGSLRLWMGQFGDGRHYSEKLTNEVWSVEAPDWLIHNFAWLQRVTSILFIICFSKLIRECFRRPKTRFIVSSIIKHDSSVHQRSKQREGTKVKQDHAQLSSPSPSNTSQSLASTRSCMTRRSGDINENDVTVL